jgi:hypothetical protein
VKNVKGYITEFLVDENERLKKGKKCALGQE